jgi:hypothetical protein
VVAHHVNVRLWLGRSGQINLFQILNYKVTMTIEKWVKEEKMRLGRFKICCVNAQKEEAKSFPLKMTRSCWSGQYRTWDDSRLVIIH